MKILPTIQNCRQGLNNAIKFCKDFLGEDANYTIDVLEELKTKYQGIVDLIKNCDNSTVKKIKTTCGRTKIYADCLAVCESKVYNQTFDTVNEISKIIEVMKVNKLTEIKGFNFSNNQIEIGSQYFYEKFSNNR